MYRIDELYDDIKNGMSLEKVHKKYGGTQIYIPQKLDDYKDRIIEEFNGYNHYYLATIYNVTVGQVYKILNENKKKIKQQSLF